MKFGKLEVLDGVDFSLPKDPKTTTNLLANLVSDSSVPTIYYGCTGWSMKEWVGTYYPKGTKTDDYLNEYAKQFNTIELNTTHYRIPRVELIERWMEKTNPNFKFSPKIPQSISHCKDLGLNSSYIDLFCKVILGMGSRLGVSFMQLPPTFDAAKLPILKTFLDRFPIAEVPLAIEVRHKTWFEEGTAATELWSLLKDYRVSTVMSDVAGRRDALHMQLTTDVAMIRFVGNNLHKTDYERIDAWVYRLKNWFQQGLQTVYFFHHQPDNLLTPQLTEYFVQKVNAVLDLALNVPKKYVDTQMKLF